MTYPSISHSGKLRPSALFGGPATGEQLVRNIYSDEAGVSAKEPVSVVLGLIVHGDTQWVPIVTAMGELVRRCVPKQYLENFALHTKTLVRKRTYPDWSMTDRYAFLRHVMRLPRIFGVPISVGAVKKEWIAKPEEVPGLKPHEQAHLMAFALCMASADKLIRERCITEMAQVIAEDHPDMKRFLQNAVNFLRTKPLVIPTLIDASGKSPEQRLETYRVERVVDEVHFMERDASPLLQIADACAFGMRRYLAGLSYGDLYIQEMTGSIPVAMPAEWTRHHRVYFSLSPDGSGKLWNPVEQFLASKFFDMPAQTTFGPPL